MIVDNKGYVLEYWMINNMVDCGKIEKNKSLTDEEYKFLNEIEVEKTNIYLMEEEQIIIEEGNEDIIFK